jgi:two-component system chemotaxis response regulator CheB
MKNRVRVLVVDDSAFARKVLREVLATSGRIEVVGAARDGLEALEQIASLSPDVVTLDLVMPNLDGVGVLRELATASGPSVVIVSMSDEESELAVEALSLGAFDFVRKPTNLATERLYELGGELVRKVLAAAAARRRQAREAVAPPPPAPEPSPARASLIVVGTSTGGPQALTRLVPAFPPTMPPVAIALHIPAEYTGPMAARLNALSRVRVLEAREGLELAAGTVALAHGGSDLEVERQGERLVARLVRRGERAYHPSVDALFESAARACGPAVVAVILTGMGDDGLAGARAVRAAGGRVLVESVQSAIVDGMPRSVREAGLAHADVPLGEMAAAIVGQLGT